MKCRLPLHLYAKQEKINNNLVPNKDIIETNTLTDLQE